ncbi:MAG: nitroreductase family protein [Deltaproteobacteria bacterium]|nr:nitroreductase family protein [Deltaproteobacteria bacterium]
MKNSIFLEKLRYAHYPPTKYPRFEFDEDKCKHCKACFLACPTTCIQWNEKKKIPYPTGLEKMELACLSCNNCEAVCPTGAIRARGEYRVLKGRYRTTDDRSKEMYFPTPFGKKDLERSFTEIEKELTEVERVIYRRRSIRIFQDKPVPRELVERIIEAAQWAPSAGNCQPWKFVVIVDKKKIEELDRKCAKVLYGIAGLYQGSSWWRSILVPLVSYLMVNKMDQRPIAAIEKVKRSDGIICFGAPVVIHVLMDVRGIGDPILDTALACQNLVLAAHSLGLGTLYIGLIKNGLKYLPKRVSKELGITYPYAIVTSICIGYAKGKLDNPVARNKCPVEWIS